MRRNRSMPFAVIIPELPLQMQEKLPTGRAALSGLRSGCGLEIIVPNCSSVKDRWL